MKSLLYIALLLIGLPATAQTRETTLKGIPTRSFSGVEPMEGLGYYTIYFSESGENNMLYYIFHLMDRELKTISRDVLEVPIEARFIGGVRNGSGLTVVYQEPYTRTWFFYTLNEKGKLTGTNSLQLDPDASQVPIGNMQLVEATSPGFYVLQPYSDTAAKKVGYEVVRLDENTKVKWAYSHYDEPDLSVDISSLDAGQNYVALLQSTTGRRSSSGRFEKFENEVVVLSDADGKKMYSYSLYDGEDSGYPEYVIVNEDGSLATAGMYFSGTKFDKQNSDGLFFLNLSPEGKKAAYTKVPWTQVESQLKSDPGSSLISGNTKVLIQDIVRLKDGSYSVIGELFKKTTGTTAAGLLVGEGLDSRAITIQDFIVFNFAPDGTMKENYTIEKQDQSIMLPESLGRQKGLSISYLLRNYDMFSYVDTKDLKGIPQVVFTNTVEGEKNVYYTPLAQTPNRAYPKAAAGYRDPEKLPEEMTKLEKLEQNLDKAGRVLNKTFTGTDQTFTYYRDPTQGMLILEPQEVVVYRYLADTKTLELRRMMLR